MDKNKKPVFLAHFLSALGFKKVSEVPHDGDGNLTLDDKQEATVLEEFPENVAAVKKKVQESLAAELGLDAEKKAARQKANEDLAAALAQDDENGEEKPNGDSENPTATNRTLEENAAEATQVINQQRQQIAAMGNLPEPDEVMQRAIPGAKKAAVVALLVATTATHLFGMNKAEFSLDRSWNKRASLELNGKLAGTTDFTDSSTIADLNEDLKAHYTKNPEVLRELAKDRFGLPAFWPKRFNVVDSISDAVIDVANVTQGRKPEWSPNPDFLIEAEKRKNYPVQIDVEFSGYQLQQLETAWINTLFDMDGSSPYKLSFIAYLIKKIDDQARIEDRISSINGIYVFKPKGIKAKGSFLNRQNGLRYQLFKFRDIDKKIIAYKSPLGDLSASNAYAYFEGFKNWLTNKVRTSIGLKIYVGQNILNGYREGHRLANGTYQNYEGSDLSYIDGYPNLQFVVLTDLEGSNVFFMTDENNIEILENVPNEKSIYRMEMLNRDTFVHADYYQAAAFVFAGFKLPADSPFLGQTQFIWMNDAPLFSPEVEIPLYGNLLSAPVKVDYNRVRTDINLLTDVNTIETTLLPGMIMKITGNTAQATNSVIKNKTAQVGNLDLSADFNPKLGGTLTLLVTTEGLKELGRTNAPVASTPTAVEFDGTAFDANEGSEFKYVGTSSQSLEEILNGVEGAEVKVYGQVTNTLTVATVVDKIQLTGATYVMNADTKSLTLKKFDGVWYEIARVQ